MSKKRTEKGGKLGADTQEKAKGGKASEGGLHISTKEGGKGENGKAVTLRKGLAARSLLGFAFGRAVNARHRRAPPLRLGLVYPFGYVSSVRC